MLLSTLELEWQCAVQCELMQVSAAPSLRPAVWRLTTTRVARRVALRSNVSRTLAMAQAGSALPPPKPFPRLSCGDTHTRERRADDTSYDHPASRSECQAPPPVLLLEKNFGRVSSLDDTLYTSCRPGGDDKALYVPPLS